MVRVITRGEMYGKRTVCSSSPYEVLCNTELRIQKHDVVDAYVKVCGTVVWFRMKSSQFK